MSETEYAKGGAKLGRTRDFVKEPDRFRETVQPNPPVVKTDEDWGKDGGTDDAPKAKDTKVLKTVMPRT